jgi:hypothetical protein
VSFIFILFTTRRGRRERIATIPVIPGLRITTGGIEEVKYEVLIIVGVVSVVGPSFSIENVPSRIYSAK